MIKKGVVIILVFLSMLYTVSGQTTAPIITHIEHGNISCQLENGGYAITAEIIAKDEIPIEHYFFSLRDSKGNIVIDERVSANSKFQITIGDNSLNLNLTPYNTYYVYAKARNAAWVETEKFTISDGVRALPADDMLCLEKEPPVVFIHKFQASDGIDVTLSCSDFNGADGEEASGCDHNRTRFDYALNKADCYPFSQPYSGSFFLDRDYWVCYNAYDYAGNKVEGSIFINLSDTRGIIPLPPGILGHSVEGNKVTINLQGTPPFMINIRGDDNIGAPGGYLWTKVNSNKFTYDMSFASNQSDKFYYGVNVLTMGDDSWFGPRSFSLGVTEKEEALEFALSMVETYFTKDCDAFYDKLSNPLHTLEEDIDIIKTNEIRNLFCEPASQETPDTYTFLGMTGNYTFQEYLNIYDHRVLSKTEYEQEFPSFKNLINFNKEIGNYLFVGWETKPNQEGFMWDDYLAFMVRRINGQWKISALLG